MQTVVYVDGFHFYYGCLKGVPVSQLDLGTLFGTRLLPAASGGPVQLQQVHYFTSPLGMGLSSLASDGLRVWCLEEKQADVRLGMQCLHDALTTGIEQIVFCALDGDLVPALQMLRELRPDCRLGLVVPSRATNRLPHPALLETVDWYCPWIPSEDLAAASLRSAA